MGFFRTGKLWAIEHFGVEPDIMCMAKAIGGGLPLGVTLAKENLMRWHVGAHASTFGGNPVAIVAGLKTFEILEKGVMNNAAEMGTYMMDRLRELQRNHEAIAQVRGLGLMIGVEIARDSEASEPWTELRDKIVVECFNRGLVIQGAGESAVRFSPPLIVDREQVDFAVATFEAVLKEATK
jgi:4-aminobutyrate aminotransferase